MKAVVRVTPWVSDEAVLIDEIGDILAIANIRLSTRYSCLECETAQRNPAICES